MDFLFLCRLSSSCCLSSVLSPSFSFLSTLLFSSLCCFFNIFSPLSVFPFPVFLLCYFVTSCFHSSSLFTSSHPFFVPLYLLFSPPLSHSVLPLFLTSDLISSHLYCPFISQFYAPHASFMSPLFAVCLSRFLPLSSLPSSLLLPHLFASSSSFLPDSSRPSARRL